jgi:hypothetical protein
MTPQLLAMRKAEADTLRKYFNPGSTTTMYCDGNGPCDPLEAWTGLTEYIAERRGVVIIQVTPQVLPAPYRGERSKPRDIARKPPLIRVQVMRDNAVVPTIEDGRIYAVVNPGDYPTEQRELIYSWIGVFNPNDLVQGKALELIVYTGRNQVRLSVPASVLDGVRRDMASVLR